MECTVTWTGATGARSGMGFLAGDADESVRVSATAAWLRLDARYGAVVRRRILTLPLLV